MLECPFCDRTSLIFPTMGDRKTFHPFTNRISVSKLTTRRSRDKTSKCNFGCYWFCKISPLAISNVHLPSTCDFYVRLVENLTCILKSCYYNLQMYELYLNTTEKRFSPGQVYNIYCFIRNYICISAYIVWELQV